LFLTIIIANNYNQEGYNLINNYISDLGSFQFTPTPYIFNIIVIITSLVAIPIFFYLEEILASKSGERIRIIHSYKLAKILARVGQIIFLLGSIGLCGIGVFNEDFPIEQVHYVLAFLAFGGFTLGGAISGFLIIVKKAIISPIIGVYIMSYSLGLILLRAFQFLPLVTLQLIEWTWFLGILLWLIPITLTLLKSIDNSLTKIDK
jgi:hypothetical membrane protein